MNHNVSKSRWKQMKGESSRKQWGRLTKDDLDLIEGEQLRIAGHIQERYGRHRNPLDREYDDRRNAPGD